MKAKIPIKKYVDDDSLPWEERYRKLEAHHLEETRWLITQVELLEKRPEAEQAPELKITQVFTIDGTNLVVFIDDGRVLSVPVSWFPKLDNATAEQRSRWRLIAGGRGICWEELDEDLSLRGLLSERAQPLPRP